MEERKDSIDTDYLSQQAIFLFSLDDSKYDYIYFYDSSIRTIYR